MSTNRERSRTPKGSKKEKQIINRSSMSTESRAQSTLSSSVPPQSAVKSPRMQRAHRNHHRRQQQQSTQSTTTTTTTTTKDSMSEDHKLLLTPEFSAMTRVTDNLFLTGVGGMTRENFRKNHIDFVVNITTDAPFWNDIESMRLALEDETSTNMLPYLDVAADKIHDQISKRNAHVLVHCVAGVSRSATVVIAYLMKYKLMDLKSAFNLCSSVRPVIRPNNGFMVQLISYEQQLFGKTTVKMIEADVDGTIITVPDFFIDEHPRLVILEVLRVRDHLSKAAAAAASNSATAMAELQTIRSSKSKPVDE